MEDTGWDCPNCGSEVKKIDKYEGYKLSCRECGNKLGMMDEYYLKISKFVSGVVSI